MNAIKGTSSHKINKQMHRRGKIWQTESFDHVLRCSENIDAKVAYLLENPIRAGLVASRNEYPWLWRSPFENPFAPG